MEYMHELKEMLCEELERIADKGGLTAGSLDTVDKLTHSIKSIATIMAMEGEGYSGENYTGETYRGYRGGYRRGGSYRQGGSRRSMRGGSYRRNSRTEETDMIVNKLEKMMEKVEDPNAKQALEEAIEAMEM